MKLLIVMAIMLCNVSAEKLGKISFTQANFDKTTDSIQGEFMPFLIKYDGVENATIVDLKDVLKNYKNGRLINIVKVSIGERTGQAFYISANNTNVELRYTCEQSLENAVYTYIDMLGIRWYGAGENWLVKPTVLNEIIIKGEWKEPSFRNRIFAGTGGLEYPLSIDPKYNYRNNWYTWKRRNRFNADFNNAGHVGDLFYLENKEVLDAHPHWFNSIPGKRYGRLKIENDSAMQVYKEWAIKRYDSNALFTMISTDSEDGKGGSDDPLPPDGFKGIKKWNHADKWWWLTNEVAKLFVENNDKVKVGALSYGDGPYNALVPKFKLRKNVYPMITPYAFQTAYQPNQMVRTWAEAIKGKMDIYDYWNITQWSLGLPQFNIYTIPEKLNFWNKNKVGGMNIETTDASGPMGHAWWLAGQLEWDLTKNIDTLFNKYLKDCFGLGWKPMERMYKRWSINYQQNADVNFSLSDLNEATKLVEVKSLEWKRINDVKAYVHFMKLMAERTFTKANNDSIYQYIYSIHQRMLVQTVALTGQQYLGPAPEPISAHQLTENEIEQTFTKDLGDAPLDYSILEFVFDFDKVKYTDSIPNAAWRFGIFTQLYFKAPFSGRVIVNMGGVAATPCKIFTADNILIEETVDSANSTFSEVDEGKYHKWYMKKFVVNVVKGETYFIKTERGFGRATIKTPGIVLFSYNGGQDFDNFAYPVKYFYVPKGTKEIAFYDAEPEGLNGRGFLFTPNGILLHRIKTNSRNIYKVLVPAGMDGKTWVANFGHPTWSFKNIPNQTSLQKFVYKED